MGMVLFHVTFGQKQGDHSALPAPQPAGVPHPSPQSPAGSAQPSPPHIEPSAPLGTSNTNTAPSSGANNASHPCTNSNISECFHLIAVQMNKTEEPLQMANQTLNANKGVPNPVINPIPATNNGNSANTGTVNTVNPGPASNVGSLPVSSRVENKKTREKREVKEDSLEDTEIPHKKQFRLKHLKKGMKAHKKVRKFPKGERVSGKWKESAKWTENEIIDVGPNAKGNGLEKKNIAKQESEETKESKESKETQESKESEEPKGKKKKKKKKKK